MRSFKSAGLVWLYRAIEVQCISRRAGNNAAIQLNSETIE